MGVKKRIAVVWAKGSRQRGKRGERKGRVSE